MKTCTRLGRIKATLKEKLVTITDLGEKIIAVCDVEEIEKEIEDAEALKMRIMDAIENISTSSTPSIPTQNTLSVQEVQQASSINDNLNHSASMSSASPPTLHYPTASPTIPPLQSLKTRLPKITLAKFKGEVTQFRSFWDSLESTIHSNPGLTKIDKFNYLISLLEGAASRSVAGLPITEHNYDAAIDIIHNRFGKTQQLVSAYMDELLKISACSSDKPSHLRYLYDKISVNVRGLEALGVKTSQYGSLLIPIIMAKLPPDVRVLVARNTTQDVWDIESMLKVIDNEIEAREISEKVKAMTSTSESKRHQFQKNSTLGAFVVNSKQALRIPTCVYCSGMHFSASCESITDVSARKAILQRDRRCFSCLKKGHRSDRCERSCRKCNRKHHQSICLEQNKTPPVTTTGEANIKDTDCNGTTITTYSSENTKPKRKVLLQTATAIASNDEGTKSTTVRLLFDNGSQRSYITDSLREKLRLKSVQTEKLNLNTFGETQPKKQSCDLVKLQLRKSEYDDPISISASTFQVICSPLPA